MQAIVFTGGDSVKGLAAAKKEGWDEVLARSPEHGAALKKLFTKN